MPPVPPQQMYYYRQPMRHTYAAVLGGVGLSSEVSQFLDRLITLPSAGRQTVYATLIDGLVADGVWAKLDALYLWAVADEATAHTNLISSSYTSQRSESSGSLTFTADSGFSGGASTRQVTSNFNPSTASNPKFTRNDAMVAVWSGTTAVTNRPLIQMSTGAPNQTDQVDLWPRFSGTSAEANINSGTAWGFTNSADNSGLFIVQRTGANASAVYRNGDNSLGTNAGASAAVANSKISVEPSHLVRALVIGQSLTSGGRTALYDRLAAYMTSVVGSTP